MSWSDRWRARCRPPSRCSIACSGALKSRRARTILTSVRDLSDYARHSAGSLVGELVLSAIPSIAPYLLPAALPLVRKRHPSLELTLRETQTATLVGELLAGQLDAILLSLPLAHPELATFALFGDRFLLATSSATPFDETKPRTPDCPKKLKKELDGAGRGAPL